MQAALPAATEVEHVVLSGDAPLVVAPSVTLHSWEDLLDAGEPPADGSVAPTGEDSWALWFYTSGTTGMPKAAMHRHANIRHVAETYGAQVLGIRPDDVTFSCQDVLRLRDRQLGVLPDLDRGDGPARPEEAHAGWPRSACSRPADALLRGPTFYGALTQSDVPAEAFGSVRMCASAGEALPAPLQRRFTDRFGVDILDGIGSTEALHIFLSNRPGDIHPGTTGVAVPGYELEPRDTEGRTVPDGEPGALHVKGESIALGYWHRTATTRQVFQGEWLVTGDTYVRNDEGYYVCLGRNSDMLKAGGIWVSPGEVESRLLEHPAVREAAVVGVPDENGLDKPVAVVVVGEGASESDLVAWCREGLAHFKAPRQVVFVTQLPKTATGKLQRFKVRDLVSETPDPDPAAEPKWHRDAREDTRGGHSHRRRGPGWALRRLLLRRADPELRRRRLAQRGRRPGHRDVPGEADLRRRRLPRRDRPGPGARPLRAGVAARPVVPAGAGGAAAREASTTAASGSPPPGPRWSRGP